jgi:hypothetical protein
MSRKRAGISRPSVISTDLSGSDLVGLQTCATICAGPASIARTWGPAAVAPTVGDRLGLRWLIRQRNGAGRSPVDQLPGEAGSHPSRERTTRPCSRAERRPVGTGRTLTRPERVPARCNPASGPSLLLTERRAHARLSFRIAATYLIINEERLPTGAGHGLLNAGKLFAAPAVLLLSVQLDWPLRCARLPARGGRLPWTSTRRFEQLLPESVPQARQYGKAGHRLLLSHPLVVLGRASHIERFRAVVEAQHRPPGPVVRHRQ